MVLTQKTVAKAGIFVNELKNAILDSENARKLLFYDDPDALTRIVPSVEQVKDYIFTAPILESGIKDFERNTYVIIDVAQMDLDFEEVGQKEVIYNVAITAITDLKHWELQEKKLRLFELCDAIIKSVDNQQMSMTEKVYIFKAERVIIDSQLYGYVMKITISDNVAKASF